MEENLFDKIIKVLWIIVACVALYIFYPKIKTIDRYEVVMGKGKTVYRFDKSKGVFAQGEIPNENYSYYEFDENNYRYTAHFALPENDGTKKGIDAAIKEKENNIIIFKDEYPNAKKVTTLRFEDIIK